MFSLINGVNLNYQNKQGNTALYVASKEGNTFLVKMLLQNGADPKIPNNINWNPLMVAKYNNYDGVIDLLQSYLARSGGRKRNKKSNKRRKTIRKKNKRKTFKRK